MKPEVTVVVPVYKRPQFIDALMEGMFKQTLSNWELIFVDDGSDMPELTEICRRYERQDKRVKYIRQENGGVAAARNRGAAESSAEFLAMHDSDDISHPCRLEKQVDFLRKNPRIASVDCFAIGIDETGTELPMPHSEQISQEPIIWEINSKEEIGKTLPSVCCRRECFQEIGGYDADFRTADDYEFSLRMEEKYPLAKLREKLYLYRRHGGEQLHQHSLIWQYLCFAYVVTYFRRNNLPEPAGNRPFHLLSYAKFLPKEQQAHIFKWARGCAKREMLRGTHEELKKTLDDFNAAFSFSPKHGKKMYKSLIIWSLYHGKIKTLPLIIKSRTAFAKKRGERGGNKT